MGPSLVMSLKCSPSFISEERLTFVCIFAFSFSGRVFLFYLFCLFYSTLKCRLHGGTTACIVGAIFLCETVNEWIPTELSQRIEISGIQVSQQVSTGVCANLTCCSTCKFQHFFLLSSHPFFLLLSIEESLRSISSLNKVIEAWTDIASARLKHPVLQGCPGTRENS